MFNPGTRPHSLLYCLLLHSLAKRTAEPPKPVQKCYRLVKRTRFPNVHIRQPDVNHRQQHQ
jgi:hypothetical protein